MMKGEGASCRPRNAGRRRFAEEKASSHAGDWSSGIGLAAKSLRHWRAVQRAQALDFFRRALSVGMPVPAYIWRESFDKNMKARRARRVGVQAERCQMEDQS